MYIIYYYCNKTLIIAGRTRSGLGRGSWNRKQLPHRASRSHVGAKMETREKVEKQLREGASGKKDADAH